MSKFNLGNNSSFLVSLPAIIIWAALGIISALADYRLLACMFFFLFLLCGSSRLWGQRAMNDVSLNIHSDATRLFPGMSTKVSYTIKNEKFLPLIWLELSQNVPDRDCLVPDDSFERYSYQLQDVLPVQELAAYRRTFSFVMSYETLTLSGTWTAMRRGFYKPEHLLLRSGDGFGLSQIEQPYPAEKLPEFLVYPKKVPVDVSLFLRNDWERTASNSGFVEDISVLRGTRPYMPNDMWKRINWRMAARQPGELKVNFYETVQPVTALFILDGESFCGLNDEFSALEEALEVLGSVTSELFMRGVSCGLCIPKSARFEAVNLPPSEERTSSEILYYLAGYDCCNIPVLNENNLPTGEYLPSKFDINGVLAASFESGMTSIITYSADRLPARLMNRIDTHAVTVFASTESQISGGELKVLPLSTLKKEETAC